MDRTTIILSITAGVLLVLVVLFLDKRIVGIIFPTRATVSEDEGGSPVLIERIVTEEVPDGRDQVVELGIPEQAPETPVESGNAESVESGAMEESTARLFFVRVSDEGKISVKSVLRTVPASGSPLSVAMGALMDGPRPGELSNDVLSLIPEGSEMIGARIEGGIAFLDFNEQFRFNALGIEGYKSQVEQIVYTATEFATVEKVQILIEGQRIEYLGGEGFWVGGPLGRDNF